MSETPLDVNDTPPTPGVDVDIQDAEATEPLAILEPVAAEED